MTKQKGLKDMHTDILGHIVYRFISLNDIIIINFTCLYVCVASQSSVSMSLVLSLLNLAGCQEAWCVYGAVLHQHQKICGEPPKQVCGFELLKLHCSPFTHQCTPGVRVIVLWASVECEILLFL